jgi:predicted amidohydrolase YtcJ
MRNWGATRFIDCHNHAPGTTLMYDVLVGNPYEVEFVTIDSIVDKLRAKAMDTPADTWVEGYFFDGELRGRRRAARSDAVGGNDHGFG